MKCAAWEEKFDTCGWLRDMRSCQDFKGAAPLSTPLHGPAVNLKCVLRCEGGGGGGAVDLYMFAFCRVS